MHISDIQHQRIGSTLHQLLAFSRDTDTPDPSNISRSLSALQVNHCKIAQVKGCYGSYYGSQAYHGVLAFSQAAAVGHVPELVDLAVSARKLKVRLEELASQGYIGVMVEMVSSRKGNPLPAKHWAKLATQCRKTGLGLIVDEAVTAVRCGAPFAFQRPEYKAHQPDFVLFGKALRVAGLALNPSGATLGNLGLTKDDLVTFCENHLDRQASNVVYMPAILESLAVVRFAKQNKLPERAQRIGSMLRTLLLDFGLKSKIKGLDSLIYIPRTKILSPLGVVSAAAGNSLTRWFPYLDVGMENSERVKSLLNPEYAEERYIYYQTMAKEICVECGDMPVPGDGGACKTCSGCYCGGCWDKPSHKANCRSASKTS
ncbi:pyridoxal phosphate-dependent transferase [Microdochium trichocladiopsis]|uniref:Pyridoxal phosphate-dependent transferase n=1 Tax=Microdochium trichocladiopsis TaxID=1682393 RepID=A0A9P8XQP4_9PEZI|nr:pyridoxal phosphate-dependent transferase [Microdochium trichocladiopsis]KAH7012072.1 pyridoxal phosphate-dependent transferase [Microdochium trichocladiopsis]